MSPVSSDSKICNKCGQEKALDEYHVDNRAKDGHLSQCKDCKRDRRQRYYRDRPEMRSQYDAELSRSIRLRHKVTWQGFAKNRWKDLNRRTINGANPDWKHPPSRRYLEAGTRLEMTYEDFEDWCGEQAELIESMYGEAEQQNQQSLIPSLDRIDPDGHYSLSNLQIITWSENSRRAALRGRPE